MAIKLVVAGSLEDHAVLKYALSASLPEASIDVGTDGFRAVELALRIRPQVVVVDPAVAGELTGADLVARLKGAMPETAIACWTARADVDEAARLLRAGASAYLLKEDGPKDLVRQIPAIVEGGLVMSPRVAAELTTRFTDSIQRESELTKALAETTMQLQEVAGSKDQFVANVNHELRTPVTIVKGIAHLLKSGRLSHEDQEQFVKRMDDAVERLTTMVDEILTVSDLGNGRMSLQAELTDMVELVGAACDRVTVEFPALTLDRHLIGPILTYVDPTKLTEAMTQLIDNACRYSPERGRVIVALRRVAEGIMFSVTDSGEGLPRALLTRAFREPFVTGEEILRKERAGLGVGLHLARQLVVLHGGILWADPLPGGGTRVSFCIPEQEPPVFDVRPRMESSDTTDAGTPQAPGVSPAREPVSAESAGLPTESELRSLLQNLLQE
jgi:signal transduction histidine kinase